MKKYVFMVIFGWLAIVQLHAQAVSKETILKEISEAAAQIKTMQCDFVQTKHMKMLDNKLVSKGKMSCSQPDKLRWEYVSPYTYTFLLSDGKVVLKKGNKTDVYDVNRHKMFREIAAIMMNSVMGNCLSDRSFEVDLTVEDKQYVATLTPRNKEMKMMFTHIVVYYDRIQSMVNTVQLHEKNGDTTTIELQHVRKNEPINDSIYHVE